MRKVQPAAALPLRRHDRREGPTSSRRPARTSARDPTRPDRTASSARPCPLRARSSGRRARLSGCASASGAAAATSAPFLPRSEARSCAQPQASFPSRPRSLLRLLCDGGEGSQRHQLAQTHQLQQLARYLNPADFQKPASSRRRPPAARAAAPSASQRHHDRASRLSPDLLLPNVSSPPRPVLPGMDVLPADKKRRAASPAAAGGGGGAGRGAPSRGASPAKKARPAAGADDDDDDEEVDSLTPIIEVSTPSSSACLVCDVGGGDGGWGGEQGKVDRPGARSSPRLSARPPPCPALAALARRVGLGRRSSGRCGSADGVGGLHQELAGYARDACDDEASVLLLHTTRRRSPPPPSPGLEQPTSLQPVFLGLCFSCRNKCHLVLQWPQRRERLGCCSRITSDQAD